MEKAERMEEILAPARAKAAPEKRDTVERFVNAYFQQVAPEDLMERRADDIAALTAELPRVLGDVRRAVTDWKKMKAKVDEALSEIDATRPPLAPDEVLEGKAFLRWLAENHFTFLGYRCYDLTGVEGEE